MRLASPHPSGSSHWMRQASIWLVRRLWPFKTHCVRGLQSSLPLHLLDYRYYDHVSIGNILCWALTSERTCPDTPCPRTHRHFRAFDWWIYYYFIAFENGITEAPWLVLRNGTYYLFYSASGYSSPDYCVSVARASSILVSLISLYLLYWLRYITAFNTMLHQWSPTV